MASLFDRFRNLWNAFNSDNFDYSKDPDYNPTDIVNYGAYGSYGTYGSNRPWRSRFRVGTERTIVAAIYARMSLDAASIQIRHTRRDSAGRYADDMDSGLNECLTVEPNLDQGPSAFLQDLYLTLFDKGVAAIVPVDTDVDPTMNGGFDIRSMRIGEIVQWFPQTVKVNLWNERTGRRQDVVLPKRSVAIIENPFYTVMNEANSTLQRLIYKLSLLDRMDAEVSSGKLDLIIQLPYVVRGETKKKQAEQRRQDIEFQLKSGPYGIAYADGTEKITQLNRPVENNLLGQVQYLTTELYGQLGITPEIMNGTASEDAMINYMKRTIEPIVIAAVENITRKFLTKTARTRGQGIDYFNDVFKLIPMSAWADLANALARNEIVTANEIRGFFGLRPSTDPKADQLQNSNMPQASVDGSATPVDASQPVSTDGSAPDPNADESSDADLVSSAAMAGFKQLNGHIDDILDGLNVPR